MKYFSWNIDDGLEQDKRIVEILRRYNMGATFNINAGLFGYRDMTRWENDLPIEDVPLERARTMPGRFVEHYRIPADEAVQVYEGFEIAAHAYRHENFGNLTPEEITASLTADIAGLEKVFGQKIRGFAYPYGVCTDEAVACLKKLGIRYARTTETADSFAMPKDLLRLGMNGRHGQSDIFQRLDDFFAAESEEDLHFMMFAHGYEFDFGTPESNWEKLERICQKVASQPGIICCSTGEALKV